MAVTLPDIITLPELSKWKLEELISISPNEPLIYCPELPKKKVDALITKLSPSNVKRLPSASPIKTFTLLSPALLPCTQNPLFVPSIPVGLGLPADINPPSLELINKLFALNLKTSTSTLNKEAVTSTSSDFKLISVPSKVIYEVEVPIANLYLPSVSLPIRIPPAKSPLLKVEPLPNWNIWSTPLIVIALLPVPAVNLPLSIVHPPISPAVAETVPCMVAFPPLKWNWDEDISILPPLPLIYCEVSLPTKNAFALISSSLGSVLNLK